MQVCSALIVALGGTDNVRGKKKKMAQEIKSGRDVGACQSDYWPLIKEQTLIKGQTLPIKNKIGGSR